MNSKLSKIILACGTLLLSSILSSCDQHKDKKDDLLNNEDNYASLEGTYKNSYHLDYYWWNGDEEYTITLSKDKKIEFYYRCNYSDDYGTKFNDNDSFVGKYIIEEVCEHEGKKLYHLKVTGTGSHKREYLSGVEDNKDYTITVKNDPIVSIIQVGYYIHLVMYHNWSECENGKCEESCSYKSSNWFKSYNTPILDDRYLVWLKKIQ